MSLQLRTVLDLGVVRAGEPEILTGGDSLDVPVRWVHVAELRSLADLLEGGELVLTTGLAFGKSAGQAAEYLSGLQAAGAAGVVVEIPPDRPEAAAALETGARLAAERSSTALPVVRLHRTVRFVEVTEVVHRRIVASQLEQVEKARQVHEVFTMLSLQSAGVQEIVDRTAQLLDAPVVLEDSSHLVVAFAAGAMAAQELLQDWQRRSRAVHVSPETRVAGDERWLQTPVGLGSTQWGRLVLPGVPRAPGEASEAAMVLERAGQALSINRLAERDQAGLVQQAQAGLIHELRSSRSQDEDEALTRASALGLKPSPAYLPLVLHLDSGSAKDPMSMQRKERALLEGLDAVLAATRNSALAAALQTGQVAVLLALPARMLEDGMLERICGDLASRTAPGELVWTAGVGRARTRLADAAAGLDEAAHVAQTASTLSAGANRYFRSTDVRLRGLLALLREDPRAVSFAEAELRGLEAEEDLALLQRFLECGGNKTSLARTGYLSRPTLYARLQKLESRLGVSLDDPESRTSLHVAVLLRQLQALSPAG
ncbi:PucR family transcriptional regulator [Arthrobacter luteolus]|uniref:PucR family transcriptional regulator n=1 Tax=Arthrobacter luteolus TaxID=98672 RepID=UPI00384B5789